MTYDEADLRAVEPPVAPADFADFWRATFAEAAAVPPRPVRRLLREGRRGRLYEVEFDGWPLPGSGPVRLGGWLTVPPGPVLGGLVVTHGYGGRSGPDPSPPTPEFAVIYPCLRGFDRSAQRGIPNVADRHVLHGIGSRQTYVHRGCCADVWAAASALLELEPATAGRLGYLGQSFGGGIGALAVPWDARFAAAVLDVPSFGHHPLRLATPCVGSGEAVRRAGGSAHLPTLRYFDAATAAGFMAAPTLVAAALSDPAVPPPGQFAVYNGLRCQRELFVRTAAHVPETAATVAEDRVFADAAAAMLTRIDLVVDR